MYGLEGILGNLVTSVATPAIGGLGGKVITDAVVDSTMPQLLKEMTQTTAGALSGAALGAGIGAVTGGKSGAVSGALTGGIGGGLGGYHAQDIAPMFGMGQTSPQGVGASQGSRGDITGQLLKGTEFNPQQTLVPPAGGVGPGAPGAGYMGMSPDTMSAIKDIGGAPPPGPVSQGMVNVQRPLETAGATPPPAPSEYKGYIDFLKKNYEPLAGGFFLGSSYGASQDTKEQAKKYKQQQALLDLINNRNALNFAQSVYGYADGGPVEVGLANPQISVHFPAWAQEQIQREGGLAALQPGMRQGMANGGYVNTQPFNPQEFHPQSRITSAQPYAAAAPTSVVNTLSEGASFARGGLIDGHGDGMSDSIPATIDRREPVKVADGEYLIPKEIAHKYGPDKLKAAMTKIRAAAHAKKGQQVKQDAGKRALIQSLSGIKA